MGVRKKLSSALIYPVFTLVATIGTLVAMLLFIVPVFADIYKDLHATLPGPTLLLVYISDVLSHSSWIVALVGAAAVVAFRRYNKTPDGRLGIDALKLSAPQFS